MNIAMHPHTACHAEPSACFRVNGFHHHTYPYMRHPAVAWHCRGNDCTVMCTQAIPQVMQRQRVAVSYVMCIFSGCSSNQGCFAGWTSDITRSYDERLMAFAYNRLFICLLLCYCAETLNTRKCSLGQALGSDRRVRSPSMQQEDPLVPTQCILIFQTT